MAATAIPSMPQKHWILPSYGEISHTGNLVDISRRNTVCQTGTLVDESTFVPRQGRVTSSLGGCLLQNRQPDSPQTVFADTDCCQPRGLWANPLRQAAEPELTGIVDDAADFASGDSG